MTERDLNKSLDRTAPLSSKELAKLRKSRSGRLAERVSLLFQHRQGVDVVPLDEGRNIIVGRSHPADFTISDTSLSRQHASLELVSGEVWVEDLGSTNGTWIEDVEIERHKMTPGEELTLGAVSLTIHKLGADEGADSGLESHDRFLKTLKAEIARAGLFAKTLALLHIRGSKTEAGHVNRWLSVVRKQMRDFDVAALYSNDTIELLLPETESPAAVALAEKLTIAAPALRCGVGVFPEHATSPDELLEVTRTALESTSDTDPVCLAPPSTGRSKVTRTLVDDQVPVAESPAMVRVFESARRFATTSMPVLIRGETGTGKEVVAQTIHDASERRDKPMICVNCGAIPSQLVESTLFGHEKGAFTGANQRAKGVFESADGGTVFLDEIGEMPLPAQAALLRVLETHRFSLIGSTKEIEVDVRVIAATHRNLEQASADGEFRKDLYYRLDAMAVNIPPLRKRRDDIAPLVERFIQHANAKNDLQVASIEDEAMTLITEYSWPGNVRELRNAIVRGVVITHVDLITVEDLPERVRQLGRGRQPATAPTASQPENVGSSPIDLRAEIASYESSLIRRALEAAEWDRTRAANNLGLPVRTLSHRMQAHGIKKPKKK